MLTEGRSRSANPKPPPRTPKPDVTPTPQKGRLVELPPIKTEPTEAQRAVTAYNEFITHVRKDGRADLREYLTTVTDRVMLARFLTLIVSWGTVPGYGRIAAWRVKYVRNRTDELLSLVCGNRQSQIEN